MHRLPLKPFALFLATVFLFPGCGKHDSAAGGDEFLRLSNVGKAHLDRGEAQPALAAFEKALALNPNHPDAKLNLANAYLLAGENDKARALATAVLEQDRGSPTALYVAGVAALHGRDYTNAIQLLQQAKDIDIRVNAVSLQLGLAYEGLGKFEEALAQYEEIAQFEPEFLGLHFRFSQVYMRLNRPADAAAQLQQHQQWLARNTNANLTAAGIEKCKYTEARIPFKLEQPGRDGIKVVFTDATAEAFGGAKFSGPVGVIDFANDGRNHLLVRDGDSFRVLLNSGGKFQTNEQSFPFTNGGNYTRWLVADMNKDAVPDALVLGDRGVHLFRFATNGNATETTTFAGLKNFAAVDGLLADLNFRGDIDLVSVSTNGELRIMSNLQNMYFVDTSTNVPALAGVRQLATDDWNNDETQDLFVSRADGGVTLLFKERGGAWSNAGASFSSSRQSTNTVVAVGDVNNDLRPDLVMANSNAVNITSTDSRSSTTFSLHMGLDGLRAFTVRELKLIDYDNDGWLDIFVLGDGIRVWRNLGAKGFIEVTATLGLDKLKGRVNSFVAADLDGDCDTDFVLSLANGSVHLLRNDGGNANHQLKLHLQGTRSNPSGLGVKIDVSAGGLRVGRRVRELPVEIGVGRHKQIDSVNAQWFELSPSYTEISLTNCEPLRIIELSLPTGSCPYLYCWDGERTRFVSDFLCSAPLGLPIAPGKYIEADEDELVRVGDEKNFRPRYGNYILQITEELREVLYLDEAKLVVVDHPPGTEVHSSGKMLPGKSSAGFGRHNLVTLRNRYPLLRAVNDQELDVTATLQSIDQRFASPARLRAPQLRGFAEPHSVTLDFGQLPPNKPLMLALTGWLRFGGGMANIAASSYAEFPFPFPIFEAEVNGEWRRMDVEVGAPSGRAKTILVDLAGKLPARARRLRVTAGFEIHWDRIAMFEHASENTTNVVRLAPTKTDLHRRGYSEMTSLSRSSRGNETYSETAGTDQSLSMTPEQRTALSAERSARIETADKAVRSSGVMRPLPGFGRGILLTSAATVQRNERDAATLLVPNYDKVQLAPLWRITPSGWATRYGAVDELIASRDNALALVAAGDELTLEFAAEKLPPKQGGMEREFFLFTSGWDKDSDFHVASGTTIGPLPWHGQNDQSYATQPRPVFTNDAWIQKYNTRWVGPRILSRR